MWLVGRRWGIPHTPVSEPEGDWSNTRLAAEGTAANPAVDQSPSGSGTYQFAYWTTQGKKQPFKSV